MQTQDGNVGSFVAVNTGNVVEVEDSEGQPLAGSDDFGVWWGTERAAWVLSEQYYTVVVNGFIGPMPYMGHFVGTVEEAIHYAREHGVKDITAERG